ncbi:unnamed protein product [Tuwongella immobilis]|uniref:Uncharacterized protein n=1 Tax=Tuwongella immobilis TaxID=692036 RepID=A0A6C2YJD8_9BACT|nr:unnamed protein product [Tuwongella immobilis]VTR97589.1 unnamed protein product [Tuwongella immobilis]
MSKRTNSHPTNELAESHFFWLSVLRAARGIDDVFLEEFALRRLRELGTRVVFDCESKSEPSSHEGNR